MFKELILTFKMLFLYVMFSILFGIFIFSFIATPALVLLGNPWAIVTFIVSGLLLSFINHQAKNPTVSEKKYYKGRGRGRKLY